MNATASVAWHAVMMTWAFGFLMPMGRWAYHSSNNPKPRNRQLHRMFMVAAVLAMVWGYKEMFAAHWAVGVLKEKRFFGYNFGQENWDVGSYFWTRLAHIFTGYAIIIAVFLQASMGMAKVKKMEDEGEDKKIFPNHGLMGKVIMVGGVVNVMFATSFWNFETQYKAVIWVLAIITAGLGAFMTNPALSKLSAPSELSGAPMMELS